MRLITVAIHTYDRAVVVKALLEAEGIEVTLQNVNLEHPDVASGVRLRIKESDLPLALRIIENPELFGGVHPSGADTASQFAHTVVVPTDFSDRAYNAARVAVKLAFAHHVDVTLLNSYIDPHVSANVQLSDNLTYELAAPDAVDQLVVAATARMESLVQRLREEMKAGTLPVVRVNRKIVEGVPEDAIIAFAKENPPYLVVMGTRPVAAKEKDMIGSVTAEVLDESRFSVLTVPENFEVGAVNTPANVLFFSNLDQEDILAMDTLYRIFPDANARVTIIHMPSRHRFTDRAAGKSALALSDYCGRTFEHFTFENVPITPKTAVDELERLQSERHFDLIVVPSRRKSAFSRLFNPGIAHRILFSADVPMLVIPV